MRLAAQQQEGEQVRALGQEGFKAGDLEAAFKHQ